MPALPDFHPDIGKMGMPEEFIDHVYNVLVDEIRPGDVDQQERTCRHRFQLVFYDRLVQEGHILSEAHQVVALIAHDHDRRPEIAPDQEEKGDAHADQDPDQQVCQQDRQYCDDKGQQLVPSLPVEFPEQGGLGQLIPRHDQDGGQRTQGDRIQQGGNEEYAKQQEQPMQDRR